MPKTSNPAESIIGNTTAPVLACKHLLVVISHPEDNPSLGASIPRVLVVELPGPQIRHA
jgi:hypothetical protein